MLVDNVHHAFAIGNDRFSACPDYDATYTDYDATYTDYDATYTDYDATYTDYDAIYTDYDATHGRTGGERVTFPSLVLSARSNSSTS